MPQELSIRFVLLNELVVFHKEDLDRLRTARHQSDFIQRLIILAAGDERLGLLYLELADAAK